MSEDDLRDVLVLKLWVKMERVGGGVVWVKGGLYLALMLCCCGGGGGGT